MPSSPNTRTQGFIRLTMIPHGSESWRYTVEQQKARWRAGLDMAKAFRTELASDKALRRATQIEKRIMPAQHSIELTVTGPHKELVELLGRVRHIAEDQGVTVLTSFQ